MPVGQIGYTEGGPTLLLTETVNVSETVEAQMERVVQSSGIMSSVGAPTTISSTGRTGVTKGVFAMNNIVVSARAAVAEDTEVVVRLIFFDAAEEIICASVSTSMYFSGITDLAGDTLSEPAVFANNVGASSVEVVVESLPAESSIKLYINAI